MTTKKYFILLSIAILFLGFSSLFLVYPENIVYGQTTKTWTTDPMGIKDFVNTKGFSLPASAAMYYDQNTAKKVCELAGYNTVVSMDCKFYSNSSPFGRCGFHSPHDNTLARWNGSSFTVFNASQDNKFISSLTCGDPIRPPVCNTNSDCGTNGYTGSPFCQGNNVYQNFITYTCQNPGTSNAQCVSNTTAQLKQTCSANQVCSNGACVNQTIACNTNSDCGTNGYTGSPFCQGNNVYQNFITYTCQNPGTSNAQCVSNTTAQLKQTCSNGCYNGVCQEYREVSVQTNPATNITTNTASLNGFLNNPNSLSCPSYVWFQYGTNTNFGNETYHMPFNTVGNFTQNITLNSWGTYYFRAVAQSCNGIIYGQTLSFVIGQTTGENLTVTKTVKNITSGSGFANSIYASPSDMLLFMITLRANNQDVNNVYIKDVFPANLIYKDQLIVACTTNGVNNNCPTSGYYNYSGDITSGINLNTIYNGQTVTITYQAQVAPAINFSQGSTALTNNVYVTASNSGYIPTGKATVFVTKQAVYGASFISTGLTNNLLLDSFIFPLMLTILGIWAWRSGMFFGIEKWLDNKKKNKRIYSAEKELAAKIASIQKTEKI